MHQNNIWSLERNNHINIYLQNNTVSFSTAVCTILEVKAYITINLFHSVNIILRNKMSNM